MGITMIQKAKTKTNNNNNNQTNSPWLITTKGKKNKGYYNQGDSNYNDPEGWD